MVPTGIAPVRAGLAWLAVVLAVLVAVVAAIVVPADPAHATYPPPKCWVETDTYKTATGVAAYAVKECTDDSPPVNLGIWLEVYVCDGPVCMWAGWKYGVGYVSESCATLGPGPIRSSRLPSKIVVCD